MLSVEEATALVAGSRLFDDAWYAAQAGLGPVTREQAAAHWVAHARDDGAASPHPLFEPAWVYPGGRWRGKAPDPLSFHLSRPAARTQSPHPCYPLDELGPPEEWLAAHDPAELLPAPAPRALVGDVLVVPPGDDLRGAVRWARHLARLDADVLLEPGDPAAHRVLEAVAARWPRVQVGGTASAMVEVRIDAGVQPPRWPWLPPLLAALERPGVAAAQPLLLADDLTVAAPVLVGHPVSAVERLDGEPLPARFPGVEARRPGADGARVLATGSWLPGTVAAPDGEGWRRLAERAEAPRVGVREGLPRLRWSIDVAAGAAPIGRRWGDWHFARSLGDALERLGQRVEIDHPETRGRATRALTDVVLVVRGLEPVAPPAHATRLLWVISHPDDVTPDELAGYDVAWAASTTWAAAHGVRPLLQCTDTTRFHPGVGEPGDGPALFVGNARGGMRPVVAAARDAGVPLRVVGTGWREHGVEVAADRVANTDLPRLYATAGVVLNDHHDDMRARGFVSNRVFDVLAVGGRLVTDDVAGLREVLGTDLPVWRTPADLARLAVAPYADPAHLDAPARRALAERVVAEHSFDARAATLLDAAAAVRAATDPAP